MDTNESISKLSSLVQLDIDAVHAYSQAIDSIDVPEVKSRLSDFRSDHERHIENLSQAIRQLGGEPPEFKRDFKGFLIEGMTSLRSVTGTEGALKAMRTNEGLTNSTYEKALEWDLSQDVRDIISKNREEERRHIQYIEDCIERQVWKTAA